METSRTTTHAPLDFNAAAPQHQRRDVVPPNEQLQSGTARLLVLTAMAFIALASGVPAAADQAVDFRSVDETRRWKPEGGARVAALDPSGSLIALVPSDQSQTIVADLATGEAVGHVDANPPYYKPESLAFAPAGDRLAIGGMGAVDIHSVPSMERLHRFELENPNGGRTRPVVGFSPSGDVLVATAGPAVHFYDLETGERLHTVAAGEYGVEQVAFSRDGSLLATYGAGQKLKVWSTADLSSLEPDAARVVSEGSNIAAIAFSPDGSALTAAHRDGEIRSFDPVSGESTGAFPYGESWVRSLAYTPDGTQIVTGGGDGVIRVWDASNGELMASHPVGQVTAFAALSNSGANLLVNLHRGDVVAFIPAAP